MRLFKLCLAAASCQEGLGSLLQQQMAREEAHTGGGQRHSGLIPQQTTSYVVKTLKSAVSPSMKLHGFLVRHHANRVCALVGLHSLAQIILFVRALRDVQEENFRLTICKKDDSGLLAGV